MSKFDSISQIYLKCGLFSVVFSRIFFHISKLAHFFELSKRRTSAYHDFRQKCCQRANGWRERGKNLSKNCRKLLIFLYKMVSDIKYFWFLFSIILLWTFTNCMNSERLTCFCVPFLRDWYRRTKIVWNETTVDNTVNDLCYETKFENCVKHKNNFLIMPNIAVLSWKKYILFSENIFFCQGRY